MSYLSFDSGVYYLRMTRIKNIVICSIECVSNSITISIRIFEIGILTARCDCQNRNFRLILHLFRIFCSFYSTFLNKYPVFVKFQSHRYMNIWHENHWKYYFYINQTNKKCYQLWYNFWSTYYIISKPQISIFRV